MKVESRKSSNVYRIRIAQKHVFMLLCAPILVTVRNFVAEVMFLHVSVILSRGEGCYPSMHCRWYPSMPCSRGCLLRGAAGGAPAPGGMPAPGGCLLQGGLLPGVCACSRCVCVCGDPPESRWLLLRTVRILRECILVCNSLCYIGLWAEFSNPRI